MKSGKTKILILTNLTNVMNIAWAVGTYDIPRIY